MKQQQQQKNRRVFALVFIILLVIYFYSTREGYHPPTSHGNLMVLSNQNTIYRNQNESIYGNRIFHDRTSTIGKNFISWNEAIIWKVCIN